MEPVTVSIAGIIGALVGALSGNLGAALLGASVGAGMSATLMVIHETNREKKNRALDLIQEYTSPDFIQVRNDAGRALRSALALVKNPAWDTLYEDLSQEEWQKISKIEHFYKKLDFMVSIQEVDPKYIDAYFSNEFWHWQERYFSKINEASSQPKVNYTHLAAAISRQT